MVCSDPQKCYILGTNILLTFQFVAVCSAMQRILINKLTKSPGILFVFKKIRITFCIAQPTLQWQVICRHTAERFCRVILPPVLSRLLSQTSLATPLGKEMI